MNRNIKLLLGSNMLSHIGTGISMIALPWILIKEFEGEQSYAITIVLLNLFNILILPYAGTLIDRFSRKSIMLLVEGVGLTLNLLFIVLAVMLDEASWQLMALIFLNGTLYSFHYPSRFALAQEVTPTAYYKQINSWLEIQGQTAFILAGGLTGVLLEYTSLPMVLLIDALSYFFGFLMLANIKVEKKEVTTIAHIPAETVGNKIREGIIFFKQSPRLAALFLGGAIPFSIVMTLHYVVPIHVAKTLEESAQIMGWHEGIWAIGAMLAGVFVPVMIRKMGASETLVYPFASFVIALVVIALSPSVITFLAISIMLGWGNSGVRVARNTLMMEEVDNQMMGRLGSLTMTFSKGMQMLLVGLSALAIGYFNTYMVLGALASTAGVALIVVWRARKEESVDLPPCTCERQLSHCACA
ncbi:MFS transporter [Limibacter armeniacum]|uniref:MFS transporter n=1 Tax=Limibacter armeniacum TaxID=466084 RepID=UPI002FE5F421